MNTIAYFEIQAGNPEAAMRFYGHVLFLRARLRMAIREAGGITDPLLAHRDRGHAGGLLQRPADTPPAECGTNAYVCSMEVGDIDATAALIEQSGGQVALPKFAVPGVCWHAYFIDPEGNTFGVFQADSNAQ